MKRLAATLDAVRMVRSRIGKETTLAEGLAEIARDPDDDDALGIATAARLATGRTLPVGDGRALGVGWSLMLETMVASTGYEPPIVLACGRRTGDLGEAFGLLVARLDGAYERPGISLREVAQLFDALASSGTRLGKRRLLDAAFAKATPLETKYLAKAILGSLRVGAQEGVVEGAIARAFNVDLERVRRAAALVTDPGDVAALAKLGRLDDAHVAIGRPLAFMLATPIETIASPIDFSAYVIEEKIDGVRAQLHKRGGDVDLFGRGLERITPAFPEVVDAFRFVPGNVVLDGELVVLGEGGRPRPFQALQPRLRKTAPTAPAMEAAPVTFVAYDLLVDDDGEQLALPWSERRARLERFARERGPRSAFAINPFFPFEKPSEGNIGTGTPLDEAFQAARARGYEGLVLKRIDAPYEAGRRGQAWIKVKRAFATLDVVITAAEEGHGRRAGTLSDYTFAVWRGDELVNVGKAYSGLTDDEIDAMTRRLERLTVERYGGLRLVRPEIVLEVAFDGVQRSTRHKSGYALRFPRIVRVRDDKRADEADRIEAVDALFRSQVATGHRELPPEASAQRGRGRPREPAPQQLSLFDVEKPPREP